MMRMSAPRSVALTQLRQTSAHGISPGQTVPSVWVLGGAWLVGVGPPGRPGESPISPRLRCLAGRT